MTDATIREWEAEVIRRALDNDTDVLVQRHGEGNTWFLFYRFGFTVGYNQRTTAETGRVRVE